MAPRESRHLFDLRVKAFRVRGETSILAFHALTDPELAHIGVAEVTNVCDMISAPLCRGEACKTCSQNWPSSALVISPSFRP
jgi:hypothetical protein